MYWAGQLEEVEKAVHELVVQCMQTAHGEIVTQPPAKIMRTACENFLPDMCCLWFCKCGRMGRTIPARRIWDLSHHAVTGYPTHPCV